MKKQITNKKLVLSSQTLSHMQLADVTGGTGFTCGSKISGCATKPVGSCPDNVCP